MILKKELAELKQKFYTDRNIEVSDEEFFILVVTYPSFLVAISDESFDTEEIELMQVILSNLLTEIYKENLSEDEYNELISAYLDDFQYLNQNKSVWKEQFLSALLSIKEEGNAELSDSIKKMMFDIAEASEGTSEIEQKTIDSIMEYI